MNKREYKQLILQNADYNDTDLQASVQFVVVGTVILHPIFLRK
jgi:hypothetical protein